MSDRPTSFHDFKWACGHTGPGYCKICRDEQAAEIERLRAKNRDAFIAGWKAHITGPRGNPIDDFAGTAYEKWSEK